MEHPGVVPADRLTNVLVLLRRNQCDNSVVSRVCRHVNAVINSGGSTMKFLGAASTFFRDHGNASDCMRLLTAAVACKEEIEVSFIRQFFVCLSRQDVRVAASLIKICVDPSEVGGSSPCNFVLDKSQHNECELPGWHSLDSSQRGATIIGGIILSELKRCATLSQMAFTRNTHIDPKHAGLFEASVLPVLKCISSKNAPLTVASVGCALLVFSVPLASRYYSSRQTADTIFQLIDMHLGDQKMTSAPMANYIGNMIVQVAGQVCSSPDTIWSVVRQMFHHGMLPKTTYSSKGTVEGAGATSKACKIAVSSVCCRIKNTRREGHKLYQERYQKNICTSLDGVLPCKQFRPLTLRTFLKAVAFEQRPSFGVLG